MRNSKAFLDSSSTNMKEMELANPIAGNREEELNVLSTSVNPVRLKNNPVEIDTITARKLYSAIVLN